MGETIHEWTRLVMPWPPTLNNYRVPMPMRVHGGWTARLKTSKEGKAYVPLAEHAILAQGSPQFMGPIAVRLYFHGKRRGYDMDNFKKCLFDSLKKCGVIEDDKYIWRDESFIRHPHTRVGAVVLDIRKLTEAEIAEADTFEIDFG